MNTLTVLTSLLLTISSWPKHKLRIGKSANWVVSHSGIEMVLRHRSQQSFDALPKSMQRSTARAEEDKESWITLETGDRNLKVNCLDVLL